VIPIRSIAAPRTAPAVTALVPLLSLLLCACAEAPPPPAVVSPPAAAPSLAAAAAVPGCAAHAQAAQRANKADQIARVALDEAAAEYEAALRLDPDDHRVVFKLAMAQSKQERWGAMAKTLARAVEIAPTFANYWLELGYAREMLARRKEAPWADAKAPLERCAALDPNLAPCHVELGNVLLHLDDERGALAAYTRGIERDPTDLARYGLLAGLYLDLGRTDDAAAALTAATPFLGPPRRDKALYNLHVLWAKVHQDRGALAETARALEAARAVVPEGGPEELVLLWSLGGTYATLEPPRKAEAVALLKTFVARVCQGARASMFQAQCEQAAALISKLGGAVAP
jgi:tetratricopeptide (TPR) repeat protein